ncbi:MAG: DNA repair protein RecO [Parcubacteria group bacterium]|nr:DNA repair protein RecO [Parcubacteria group bacterium]
MSYHMYQTSGFILRSINTAEADRVVFVLTKSLGFLPLSVRAARKQSSKLRYALKNYSFVRVAFVRGKNVWRLTDAEEKASFHPIRDAAKMKAVAGLFALVGRLVHGEGENPALFSALEDAFIFLQEEGVAEAEMRAIEILASCRVLASLGYISENPALAPFLSAPLSQTLLCNFSPFRADAATEISRALKASQL